MSVADDTETEEEESDEGFTGLVQVFRVFKLARILKLARYQVLNKERRFAKISQSWRRPLLGPSLS